MTDILGLQQLLAAADDDSAPCPPLPPAYERRAIRIASGVPLSHVAAAVGIAGSTVYKAETAHPLRNQMFDRRYRRLLDAMRQRVLAKDPAGFERHLAEQRELLGGS